MSFCVASPFIPFWRSALGFLRFLRLPKERDVPGVCPAFSELNERSVATTLGDRGESGVRARELGVRC